MTINNPNPHSFASAPRGAAYCNGELLQAVVSIAVDNNNYFQADTFRVVLSLSGQPKSRDLNFWASLEKADIEILFGFPPDPAAFNRADLTSFITGAVDDIDIDITADTITLAGRDLTALLIDSRQTLAHVQYGIKPSDIMQKIAAAVGLTPVIVASPNPVGVYNQIVHALLEQKASYWDLAVKLAQFDGYQIYVKGRELHYEPRTLPDAEPYVIRYNPVADSGAYALNAVRLELTRNLTVAKDIIVDIASWDGKKNRLVKGHALLPRNYNKVTKGVAKLDHAPQHYFYAIPNLSPVEADRRAQKILEYLSSHEMNLSAELPGDVLLTPRSIIRLEGTNTPFDQVFYADSIQRTFSYDDGFRMNIKAKNQSPNNPPPN